jgi:flagellar motility protein MotE (MotC chaperone)
MTDEAANGSGAEPQAKPPKKKTMLWYVLFIIVSFNVVFFGMWTVMKKKSVPAGSSVAQADSTKTAMDSLHVALADTSGLKPETHPADTMAVDSTAVDTLAGDSTEAQLLADAQNLQNMQAEEQLMALRDRLYEKQNQLREMPRVKQQNDELAREISHLKSEIEEKSKRIQYYEKSLPDLVDLVVKKLAETQTAEAAKVKATPVQSQTSAPAQSADTSRNREAGLRKMAKIYESMTPQQAATILSRMNDQNIIDILWKMKQREAAKVLANFDPVRASRLSERLSGGKPSS